MSERDDALAELTRACEPDSFPELDSDDLEAIIDDHLRVRNWAATTFFKAGAVVYPVTRNGRRYSVVISGTTEATEPSWPTSDEGRVVSGGVTFEEVGVEYSSPYDMNGAIRAAWKKKAAKASRLMATGGMNMSKIFDNCLKMAEQYETALVG